MKGKRFLLSSLWLLLVSQPILAQNALNNAANLAGSSDNTGQPDYQTGTEVLNSTSGVGVTFETGGSFEHIGQFYVAGNGIWNSDCTNNSATAGVDYFGYAPNGVGVNMPYLGTGIRGASPNNGGKGAGRPSFGHLQLNSAGLFPVEGGMHITHSLTFNANGPGKSNVIITPKSNSPDAPANAVTFAPTAYITGADQANYINGYASVTGVTDAFTLPVGDADGFPNCLHSLTIDKAANGTVTARYLHTNTRSASTRGEGISSVSPTGNWPISVPEGTRITVSLPALGINSAAATTLRLVGWTGSQWVDLSSGSTPDACVTGGCPLTGTIRAGITELGIGSTSRVFAGQETLEANSLTLWPNPTQGVLNLNLSSGKTIRDVQVVDLQGRAVIPPVQNVISVDTSPLASDTYILEVRTTEGQTLRKHFVKQP